MRYQSIANGKKLSIWKIDNFQFVRISGYLWQNCGPGMPGPYRVAMRKPDMALRLAGRMYAAPTNRRKGYDKECRGRRCGVVSVGPRLSGAKPGSEQGLPLRGKQPHERASSAG